MAMTFSSKHGAARFFPVLKIAGDAAVARAPVALTKAVCLVGRRWGVHLPLASTQVSKLHALIVKEKDRVYIRDLASRNRVFVNGQTVREADLGTGDVVKVGPYNLQCASGFNDPDPASDDAARAPAAALEVNGGVSHAPLDARAVIIGGRAECDVVIPDDENVSSVHAVLFELDGKRYLRDLGSSAGTFVNGTRIHQQELALGDEIRVGQARLRYVAADDLHADAAAADAADVDDLGGSGLALALEDDDTPDVEVEPHDLGLAEAPDPDDAPDISSGISSLDDEIDRKFSAHDAQPHDEAHAPVEDEDDSDLITLEGDPDETTSLLEHPIAVAHDAGLDAALEVESEELGLTSDGEPSNERPAEEQLSDETLPEETLPDKLLSHEGVDSAPSPQTPAVELKTAQPAELEHPADDEALIPLIKGDRTVGVIDAAVQDFADEDHAAEHDLHDLSGGFSHIPLLPVGGPDSAVGGLPLPPDALRTGGYGEFDPPAGQPHDVAPIAAHKPLSPEETISPESGDDSLTADNAPVQQAHTGSHEPAHHPLFELVRQLEDAAPGVESPESRDPETSHAADPDQPPRRPPDAGANRPAAAATGDQPDGPDLADLLKLDGADATPGAGESNSPRRAVVRRLDRIVNELSDRVADLKSTWKQVKETRPPTDATTPKEKPAER